MHFWELETCISDSPVDPGDLAHFLGGSMEGRSDDSAIRRHSESIPSKVYKSNPKVYNPKLYKSNPRVCKSNPKVYKSNPKAYKSNPKVYKSKMQEEQKTLQMSQLRVAF